MLRKSAGVFKTEHPRDVQNLQVGVAGQQLFGEVDSFFDEVLDGGNAHIFFKL